jgi:hypothetical protein
VSKRSLRLHVAGETYTIREVRGLKLKGRRVDGLTDFNEHVIHVDSELGSWARFETEWHETIHAVLDAAGLDTYNETLVIAVTKGVTGALAANPRLRRLPR